MQRSKLWCFGDSYCEYDSNWISTIRKHCNLDLGSLGQGGSSLLQTYYQIIKVKDLIKENDRILFCVTSYTRDRFNGNFFNVMKIADEMKIIPMNLQTPEQTKAYKDYITYLYNDEEQKIKGEALIYLIINKLFKEVPTKKIAIIPSIWNDYNMDAKPIHSFTWNYLKNKFPDKDDEFLWSFIRSPIRNHWYSNEEFTIAFWKHFKEDLKPLDFDTYPTKTLYNGSDFI
tara:strand:- start:527 stop:1213 length:687 start_codon:yes stop_codon:yes gene_type:complete